MPSRQPILGSQALYSPSADRKTVHVDPATCHNISLFKGKHVLVQMAWPILRRAFFTERGYGFTPAELMREYRKVDDNVTMRLNRTVAQFRDRDRMASGSVTSRKPEEEACEYFWKDLVGAC